MSHSQYNLSWVVSMKDVNKFLFNKFRVSNKEFV